MLRNHSSVFLTWHVEANWNQWSCSSEAKPTSNKICVFMQYVLSQINQIFLVGSCASDAGPSICHSLYQPCESAQNVCKTIPAERWSVFSSVTRVQCTGVIFPLTRSKCVTPQRKSIGWMLLWSASLNSPSKIHLSLLTHAPWLLHHVWNAVDSSPISPLFPFHNLLNQINFSIANEGLHGYLMGNGPILKIAMVK